MSVKSYRLILLFLAAIFAFPAFSQDKEIKSGDAYFQDLQYQMAIESYTKAWNKMEQQTLKKQQVEFKLGDCYRLINKPAEAAVWYSKIADSKLPEKNPEILLYYADALRRLGNCPQALTYYRKYAENRPVDPLGQSGIKSCELYAESALPSRIATENMKLLNSAEDDYSPAFSSKNFDQLFFSSNRKGTVGKDHENWSGAWFSDLFTSKYKDKSWELPITADATEILNTEANEGTPVFSANFSTLFFTRCNKGADKKVYCQIMESDRQGQRWTKPLVVLSDASSNTGQPWISKNELVILYASDRAGGKGGKDIWMASRTSKNKTFGTPVNLGSTINTPGDEMFPYIYQDSVLYFSSNGHAGYGGLDLFRSTGHDTAWSDPQNLMPPLNSTADDFAIIFKDDKEGYFSSNRDGGMGGDDLYHFTTKKLRFNLSGNVRDESTLFTMADVSVVLISGNRDTSYAVTNVEGFYVFDSTRLMEDKTYYISFSKDNYFSVTYDFYTFDFTGDHDFVIDASLKPIPEEPVLLPDILYDLAKWDLKPQYQDSLMVLVKILKDNPRLVIELRSHTDSRASAEYNDDLSQKRAQSVVDFLVSRGVDPGRLIAKGYGERVPRTLDRDITRNGYTFKKGVTLTDQYIDKLSSNELKESAFELNRRTEFMVIAKDYKPSVIQETGMPVINIVNDSLGMAVPYVVSGDDQKIAECYVNDYKFQAIIDPSDIHSYIDEQQVIELMKQGALSKINFEGNTEEILKDNQVLDGAIVRVDKLRVGDKSVPDIKLTVQKNATFPLRLGSDVLNSFGTIEIDEIKYQIIFK